MPKLITTQKPASDAVLRLILASVAVNGTWHITNVITSRPILEKFGWKSVEKPLPVRLNEIENQEYAEKMKNSGCCGADEFLKLWAYTLTEYYRVVHLDMDSIIYKSMDDLYEIDKEMLFTGDYNMGTKPVPPAQVLLILFDCYCCCYYYHDYYYHHMFLFHYLWNEWK